MSQTGDPNPVNSFTNSAAFARTTPQAMVEDNEIDASKFYYGTAGKVCQDMLQRIIIDGQALRAMATVCLQSDGLWRLDQTETSGSKHILGPAVFQPGVVEHAATQNKFCFAPKTQTYYVGAVCLAGDLIVNQNQFNRALAMQSQQAKRKTP